MVEVPLKEDLTQLYVYTPGGYLPLYDENDLDTKTGKPNPLLFEDKEDRKNRMEKKQIEDGDLLSVEWAKKRAEGAHTARLITSLSNTHHITLQHSSHHSESTVQVLKSRLLFISQTSRERERATFEKESEKTRWA